MHVYFTGPPRDLKVEEAERQREKRERERERETPSSQKPVSQSRP